MKPAEVFHPGEFVADEMAERGWTIKDMRGMTEHEVQCLIGGKVSVSHSIAEKLSTAFGTSAEYWLNLQKAYNERNK